MSQVNLPEWVLLRRCGFLPSMSTNAMLSNRRPHQIRRTNFRKVRSYRLNNELRNWFFQYPDLSPQALLAQLLQQCFTRFYKLLFRKDFIFFQKETRFEAKEIRCQLEMVLED